MCKSHALPSKTSTIAPAPLWCRGLQRCVRALKTGIHRFWIERNVRSSSLRLASIENELELAREDYCGGAHATSRAPELSREIARLKDYRDALQTELDRLTTELREARPDLF